MNNMQLQYKEFLGYQFYYFDNFRSIPPLTTPHAHPTLLDHQSAHRRNRRLYLRVRHAVHTEQSRWVHGSGFLAEKAGVFGPKYASTGPQSGAARVGTSGSTRRGQRHGGLPPPVRPRSNAPTHGSGRLRDRKISWSARPPPAPRMHPPRRLMQPCSAPARRPDLRDRKWPCRHARVRPGTVARRSGARTTLPAGGTHAAAAKSR